MSSRLIAMNPNRNANMGQIATYLLDYYTELTKHTCLNFLKEHLGAAGLTGLTVNSLSLIHISLHELRPWQAHHVETNNFEAHADMIHLSLYRIGHPTLRRVPHQ